MSRKYKAWFIYLLCLGLVITLLRLPPQVVAQPQTSPASAEIRGVWLTNVGSGVFYAPWGINRALYQLSQLKFNTVYPVVWNRGHTYYPSDVARQVSGYTQAPLMELLRLGQNPLAEIVKQGKRYQLRVIPWFEYGFMAPADSELARRHPEWITLRQDKSKTLKEAPDELALTNSAKPKSSTFPNVPHFITHQLVINQVWLNPLHAQVQEFLLSLILEVVTHYDVTGIQLDDHFGMPVELGYDPFTIQLYQAEHRGKRPPNDPQNPEWMRWRANKISDFMRRIYQAVKAVKPNCIVSLSPNSQYFAYKYYLQDWQTWVQQGWVDELIVQVYRDNIDSFLLELSQPALQVARRRIPVGIGILSGLWTRPISIKQIQLQVKAARLRGFNGVSFFYWESLWGYITPESPRKRRTAIQKLFSS